MTHPVIYLPISFHSIMTTTSHQSNQHEPITTTAVENPPQQQGNVTTTTRTSSPKRRRPSNEDIHDPRAVAGLYVSPTKQFSLNNSSDFRWWTEQSFDTVYSVDSSTIPPGELIHHHHQHHQTVERETNNHQHQAGIAHTENDEVDLEGGGVLTDHSSPISWEDTSSKAGHGGL